MTSTRQIGVRQQPFLNRVITVIGIFLAFGGALILFLTLRAGADGQHDSTPVIVAAIGLFGILFTASLTLIGILLKDSLDRRAAIIQQEAESRLKAESSLKAIEMMTAKDLPPALAEERREGAVIALSSLGYHVLVLRLCERYWKEGGISPDLVMTVVDECLKSKDTHLQNRAAELIENNAERLPQSPGEFSFPPSLYLTWQKGIPYTVKYPLLKGLIKSMISKPFSYWNIAVINSYLYCLFKMFTIDEERRFRVSAALFAIKLLKRMEPFGNNGFMPPDQHAVTYSEISAAALQALGFAHDDPYPEEENLLEKLYDNISDATYLLSAKITDWPGQQSPSSSS